MEEDKGGMRDGGGEEALQGGDTKLEMRHALPIAVSRMKKDTSIERVQPCNRDSSRPLRRFECRCGDRF